MYNPANQTITRKSIYASESFYDFRSTIIVQKRNILKFVCDFQFSLRRIVMARL